jgi:hypothetical protein
MKIILTGAVEISYQSEISPRKGEIIEFSDLKNELIVIRVRHYLYTEITIENKIVQGFVECKVKKIFTKKGENEKFKTIKSSTSH